MKLLHIRSNSLFLLILFDLTLALISCNDGSESDIKEDGDYQDNTMENEEEGNKNTLKNTYDYCQQNIIPDNECFIEKRDKDSENIKLAIQIADLIILEKKPEEVKWDWGEAAMMLGIQTLYKVTGKTEYRDFYQKWMDHHIQKTFLLASSDTCAPTSIAIELYEDLKDEKYKTVAEKALYYIDNDALKTKEGGLNHMGVWDGVGLAIWVDSLFMFGNVLTKWGEYQDDKARLDLYTEQYEIFAKALQKESGFFKHATDECLFEQEEGIFWGRGNGWIVAAAYDHLRVRYNRGEVVENVEKSVKKLVDAAVKTQDADSGLWWTVLNRPGETYLETSVAALFAFGMARGYRYGYLDDSILPTIKKAIDGVKSKIKEDKDGRIEVTDVSGPTNPGTTETYNSVFQGENISYGVGTALLALIETSGLPLD